MAETSRSLCAEVEMSQRKSLFGCDGKFRKNHKATDFKQRFYLFIALHGQLFSQPAPKSSAVSTAHAQDWQAKTARDIVLYQLFCIYVYFELHFTDIFLFWYICYLHHINSKQYVTDISVYYSLCLVTHFLHVYVRNVYDNNV